MTVDSPMTSDWTCGRISRRLALQFMKRSAALHLDLIGLSMLEMDIRQDRLESVDTY